MKLQTLSAYILIVIVIHYHTPYLILFSDINSFMSLFTVKALLLKYLASMDLGFSH